MLSFVHEWNLFTVDKPLPNIETWVTAVSDVNAQCTRTVDHNILESITSKYAFTISFKRSMQYNEKTMLTYQLLNPWLKLART